MNKLHKFKAFVLFGISAMALVQCTPKTFTEPTLKEAFADKFLIGVAMNAHQITGADSASVDLITKQFNSIVAENCMKIEEIQPKPDTFDFALADQFVDFGLKHNMFIIGHTLVWHSQVPDWFFLNEKGDTLSREEMTARMKNHITTVVTRYKGKVKGWDVVNEAILDDGSYRQSAYYKILGKDFIKLAFQFAHEADPEAELYYNDYSMAKEGKRNGVVAMVKELQAEGIAITGVGMQGHLSMDFPTVEEFEKSIEAFAATGVKVMITELDISVLPSPNRHGGADVSMNYTYDSVLNPYRNGLPDSVALALHNRYASFFNLFLKHHQSISRVTLWGLTDAHSWRNGWPVPGRTDYPLLFDRQYQPKPIVDSIIKTAMAQNQ